MIGRCSQLLGFEHNSEKLGRQRPRQTQLAGAAVSAFTPADRATRVIAVYDWSDCYFRG
jgi:hypothetical protein